MSFERIILPPKEGETRYLLLLHGTGGTEHDLIEIGQQLAPGFGIVSPRGRVKEMGMNRWFKRFAEGVFDLDSLRHEAEEFANWLQSIYADLGISGEKVTALGYSNGANMGAATLSLFPGSISGLVMWRGMFTVEPSSENGLVGKNILMMNGVRDPMAPEVSANQASDTFKRFGADVRIEWLGGGHGLTEADFAITQEWFRTI